MVHKIFTDDNGNELSLFINHVNDFYIKINNDNMEQCLFICLNKDEAKILHDELGNLIDLL